MNEETKTEYINVLNKIFLTMQQIRARQDLLANYIKDLHNKTIYFDESGHTMTGKVIGIDQRTGRLPYINVLTESGSRYKIRINQLREDIKWEKWSKNND